MPPVTPATCRGASDPWQWPSLSHLCHCLQAFSTLLAAAANENVSKLSQLLTQPRYAKHINSTDEEQRCVFGLLLYRQRHGRSHD